MIEEKLKNIHKLKNEKDIIQMHVDKNTKELSQLTKIRDDSINESYIKFMEN